MYLISVRYVGRFRHVYKSTRKQTSLLLGFDHEKLTYRYAGRDFRLTDVHGHIIDGILA